MLLRVLSWTTDPRVLALPNLKQEFCGREKGIMCWQRAEADRFWAQATSSILHLTATKHKPGRSFPKQYWCWRQQLPDSAWEGALWCGMGITTPVLVWYIYHRVGRKGPQRVQCKVEGNSHRLTGWLMPVLATVDSHLIYTCVNNWRHSPKDLILLEHNFGRFVLMSVGAGSSQVLPVLIRVSLSPCKVCFKKKKASCLSFIDTVRFS